MKKKGFTLIEIIVVIALVAVIGTSGVVGFNVINKNIRINKLSQITDNVLRAAEVYIETNKETKTQVYTNKNGAVIPLNVLVDEGLLTLDYTDLTKDDIKDEYVLTMLSEEKGDCLNLKTITSWNESSNEPIYICGYNELKQEIVNINEKLEKIEANNFTNEIKEIKEIKEKLEEIETSVGSSNKLSDVIIKNAKDASGLDAASVYVEKKSSDVVGNFLLKAKEGSDKFTYYFNGMVVDNFVNFAGMCWRIVRINGDGSTKLILEDVDNLCNSSSYISGNWKISTSSENATMDGMKNVFDDFYNTKLKDYVSYLHSSAWCDEGSKRVINMNGKYSTEHSVKLYNEIKNNQEINFECITSNILDRYVWTLTGYEFARTLTTVRYSGITYYGDVIEFQGGNSYLSGQWITASKYIYNDIRSGNLKESLYFATSSGALISCAIALYEVRPAINLNESVEIESGRGSLTNPYVIKSI